MSLKDIGELSDFITGIRGIDKNLDFTSKAQSIASLLDGVDDLDIVNKIFKNSGVSKDLAEEALKYTSFSKSLDKVAKSSIEGAEQITNLEKATKGLKKTNAITDAIDTADDLSDILDSSTDIIGEKLKDIKNGFKGIGSIIAAHPIITGITAITAVGVAAYSVYKNYKKNMMEAATASSAAFKESNDQLTEQISKYKELKAQLDSGGLTSSEEYSVKQQILGIQTQITAQYGDQASGVDLVNGNLQTQLNILQQIAAENAKTDLNKNAEAYNDTKKEMEKSRKYYIGDTVSGSGLNKNDKGIGKEIYDIAKEFEDAGFSINDNGNGEGLYTIQFNGDASQAEETITEFMNRVSDLESKYTDENSQNAIKGYVDSAADALKSNQEILDNYQDTYKNIIKEEMIAQGTGAGSVYSTYNKYAEAINKYNDALLSGDTDKIRAARADFAALGDEVNDILSQGDNSKFTDLFGDLEKQLDTASIKIADFKEVLSGEKVGSSNQFKKSSEDIKKTSESLKSLKLDAVDAFGALVTEGKQAGESELWSLAKTFGLDAESSTEELQNFVNVLSEMGLVSGNAAGNLATASDSFNNFKTSVESATEDLETLKGILAESTSGSGISPDSVKSFRAMFGDEAEKALEKTANGYHLNRKALAELESQQESMQKSKFLSALNDQYDALRENTEKLAKANYMGEDTTGLENTRQEILDQISNLEDLQMQYEAATSAYQKWIDAQSSGNERDMYSNIQKGYKETKEMIERGWVDDGVRTYIDLLSSADLSTAPVEDVIAAFNRLGNTIGDTGYSILDFFTVDDNGNETTDGIYNFFDAVNKTLGDEYAKLEDGKYTFDFGKGKDKVIADMFGMDVEAVQSILRAASEAGFEINLDQPIASIEELQSTAQTAKQTLHDMGDSTFDGMDLNTTSLDDANQKIKDTESYIEQIKNDPNIPLDVKGDKLEAANQILDYLVNKKAELTETTEISFDLNSEEVVQRLENANQKLKELGATEITFDFNADVNEIDNQITQAIQLLDQFKNEDGTLNINAEGANEAVIVLQGLLSQKEQLSTPEIMKVDVSQIEGDLANAIAKVQEFQNALSNYKVAEQLKGAGVDIDTSAAQQKVQELAAEIQGLDSKTTATLGINTDEIQGALAELSKPHDVNVALNPSSIATIEGAISAIKPEDITVSAKTAGKELVDALKGSIDNVKDKSVTVSASTAGIGLVRSLASAIDSVQDKSVTISTTYKTNYKTNGSKDGNSFNGTAHVNGTANPKSGHAFVQGDWSAKRNETSLVGELGQELLVRGGKFTTIGDNGAEFVDIKKGDIIFNHLQTKELLSKGYVNSRAKVFMGGAYASGTAYSSGSGGIGRPSKLSYGMDGSASSTSNNLNSASNNLSKAASDTSEAAEKLSEAVSGYTDWVDVLFKRLESQYDLLMSQMERIAHLPHKQEKLYEAMSKNSELMSKTQQAIGTYQSHFDSIVQQSGINPLIVHQIQNGSMDISKYDDDTQKIISEAQSWYDKLVDCNKQYDDLLNKQSELTKKALENIEDYIDMMTGIESSAVDYQEALRELAAAKGESAYSDKMYGSLKESIKNQQDVAGKLQSQVRLYQDEINKLMENGSMAKWSTEWYEAQAALNGFKEEAAEAETTLIELQDQLRELDLLKLQQAIDELDRTAKRLENNTDLTESKGEQISEKDLQAQLDNANAQIQANYNKRQELLRDQAKYDVGSEKYNEIAEEIEKLDDSIYDAMKNIEDLKNKIWEVRWEPFFDGQEALDNLIKQTDDLRGLLNSDAFVGKNGGLTLDGIANIALINQGMIAAKQQIKNYNEALKKLDEDLKNGNISTEEFEEQQKDFLDQISSSVNIVEDYKDSIVDLYKQQLEAENDMAQKSIDKYSELLDIKKKNAEYSKNLRKQTKDINVLKAQIAALNGVKLFARLLFNCGEVPTTLSCYNGTGNGKRECGTSL